MELGIDPAIDPMRLDALIVQIRDECLAVFDRTLPTAADPCSSQAVSFADLAPPFQSQLRVVE